jgi:hypothetical protein
MCTTVTGIRTVITRMNSATAELKITGTITILAIEVWAGLQAWRTEVGAGALLEDTTKKECQRLTRISNFQNRKEAVASARKRVSALRATSETPFISLEVTLEGIISVRHWLPRFV